MASELLLPPGVIFLSQNHVRLGCQNGINMIILSDSQTLNTGQVLGSTLWTHGLSCTCGPMCLSMLAGFVLWCCLLGQPRVAAGILNFV